MLRWFSVWVIREGQCCVAVYVPVEDCSVNMGKHPMYISLLRNHFGQQVSKTPPHPPTTEEDDEREHFAWSVLKLKLFKNRENKRHKLAMTGDTRLTAVFIEYGVGGWSPKDSLHPENGSHDLHRCLLWLDSVHVGATYKSSRSLISNAFYSLTGMVKVIVWGGWF